MAWKVNSVSLRPSSPASNLIVGVQVPKSSPRVDFCWPGSTPWAGDKAAPDCAAVGGTEVEALTASLVLALAIALEVADAAPLVTVTKVVEATQSLMAAAELGADAAAVVAEEFEADPELDPVSTLAPPAGAVPAVPEASLVVKLENPALTMT